MGQVASFPMRRARVLGALVIVSSAWLAASPEEYEGARIAGIRFEPADQPIPEVELLRLLPFREGDRIASDAVRQSITRLYATGHYADIAVWAEKGAGGVELVFRTKPTWFVGRVAVDGVPEPPNRGQLANASKLQLGAPFSEDQLAPSLENVKDLLRRNGFQQAEVKAWTRERPGGQQTDVLFRVNAGDRASLAKPVVTGSPGQPEEKVIAATGWRRWWWLPGYKPATERRVQQGVDKIQRSYHKREYLMAKVSLEGTPYDPARNTISPVVRVEAGPKVRIRTQGAKISRGKLRELVPVFQEQSVDRDLLVEGRRNLAEYLVSQGYFDAKVEFTVGQAPSGAQEVVYQIDRGERHRLVRIEIRGNRYFDEATLRERILMRPVSPVRFRRGRFSRELLERDRDQILSLYRANGFPEVRVESQVGPEPGGKHNDVVVKLEIREGPQWFVRDFELSGVDLKIYEMMLGLLQSIAGQPYSEFNVATDRENILSWYYNNGYPEASLEVISEPDPQAHQVSLRYQVREGRRQYVRDVLIGGLETTNPKLVQLRIPLAPGDPLSLATITESQRKLNDLGIFARVDVAVQNLEGQTRTKHVAYQFEEARKYSLTSGVGAELARIGGGVASFDSPAGGPGFSPRVSLGVSRLNLFGIGHTGSLQSRVSSIQRRALLTYLAPQFTGSENLSLTFTALFDDSRNVRTFSARRWEGAAQFGQRLSKADTFQLRYAFRRVSVDQNTLKIEPGLIPLLSQPVRVGVMSATYIQDRRDDPADPRRGVYSTVDFGLASKALVSQTSYFRLLTRNASYHPIGRELVFARTLTLGWLYSLDEREIPLPERFFGGGASSHRGFPENQAGPRDLVTGFPIGGNALLVNQLELRFPLLGDSVGGVLFHDAGNVYRRFHDISFRYSQRDLADFSYMVQTVGFGIRYRTPIGPLRLDLALSGNSPRFSGFKGTQEELLEGRGQRDVVQRINRFQFHFSIGQAF